MGREVVVLGVGMTKIGKFVERSFKELTGEVVASALKDAQIAKDAIRAAYVGNVEAGAVSKQIMVQGQVWLRPAGIGDLPVVNVNNACGTGGTALYLAWLDIASGYHDCVLALGVEKMHGKKDREEGVRWLNMAKDQDELPPEGPSGEKLGAAMSRFSRLAQSYIRDGLLTKEQIGSICVKNHFNASLNPYAQYRKAFTLDEVFESPVISEPIHRAMCATIADGAAAAILCSADFARRHTAKPVSIATVVLRSGSAEATPPHPNLHTRCAREAYERAGIDPRDIDVWEIGNPTSFNEILSYEELGICEAGNVAALIAGGATALTGVSPVNPAGGHEGRGHPAGATGIGQIVELVWQMRGQAGERQIPKPLKTAASHIYGGELGAESAACTTTILKM